MHPIFTYVNMYMYMYVFHFLLESTHPFLAVFTNQTASEVFINDVIMWLEVNYIAMGMSTEEIEAMLEPLREKLVIIIIIINKIFSNLHHLRK